VLSQIMRAYRSTPHSSKLDTPNFLMLGRETRVPEHVTYHVPAPKSNVKRMRTAHEVLREQQWQVRSGDSDDPHLYKVRDWVWMTSYRRRRGQAAKLQLKFMCPYCVIEVMPNHTYKVERSGQMSVQNEARLKPYWVSPDAAGQVPPLHAYTPATHKRARHGVQRVGGGAARSEGSGRRADRPAPPPSPQEEVADTPEDQSGLTSPPVEPADTPVAPDEMEIPQIHEEEAARREPPVLVDPRTGDAIRGGRVTSSNSPPVQLERSQRTRAPPSYLRDFLCDLVNIHSIL